MLYVPPLHPTYDGPFKVLYRTPKYFKVLKNCKEYTVSVCRIKAANLLTDFLHSDDCLKNNKKSVSGKQHYSFQLPDKSKTQTTTSTRTRQIIPP